MFLKKILVLNACLLTLLCIELLSLCKFKENTPCIKEIFKLILKQRFKVYKTKVWTRKSSCDIRFTNAEKVDL